MTKRSVVKRIISISPDGTIRTGYMSATFMDVDSIRRDIDMEQDMYLAYPGVQRAEQASSAWVLTVSYHDGKVTVITYSND